MAILCFSNQFYTLPPAAALLPCCTCSSPTPQEAHRLSQLRQQMPDEFAGEVIEEEEEGDAMEQGDVMDEVGAR